MLRFSATEANSCVVCTADVCTKLYSLCNGRCCRIVTPEGCTTKRGTLSLKSFQRHEGSSVFLFFLFFKPGDSALGGRYVQSFCVKLSVNEQYRFSAEVIYAKPVEPCVCNAAQRSCAVLVERTVTAAGI